MKSIGVASGTVLMTAKCSRDRSYQLLVCTNLNAIPQVWAVRSSTFTYEGTDGRFSTQTTNMGIFRVKASIP